MIDIAPETLAWTMLSFICVFYVVYKIVDAQEKIEEEDRKQTLDEWVHKKPKSK